MAIRGSLREASQLRGHVLGRERISAARRRREYRHPLRRHEQRPRDDALPSVVDWDALERPAGRGPSPTPSSLTRDIAITDGQTLAVGDVTFTFAMVPGHTTGSIGVAFPVKDGAATRVAGLFGGSILIPGRIPDEGLRQYIQSIERWAAMARQVNVGVEIQNHPMYDGLGAKLSRLKQRNPGQPNPFVVGREGYQRFLAVMSGCTNVQLARRAQP